MGRRWLPYENRKGITNLIGKVITKIEENPDEIVFHCSSGERYIMLHEQDCCESVELEEVIGDFEDLIATPVLMAEEVSNSGEPKYGDESATWTFYKIGTINGVVTLRWYGESNGYYSEDVDFYLLPEDV